MVAVSCFGALNGAFFTSSRLICAAGREGFLPEIFGHLHPTRKTPVNATALQLALTLLFVVLGGGFRSLVNFYSVASWGFYFLTVLGLVILRIKEPFLERCVSSGLNIARGFNSSD
jgi:amino acid transporter